MKNCNSGKLYLGKADIMSWAEKVQAVAIKSWLGLLRSLIIIVIIKIAIQTHRRFVHRFNWVDV